MATKQDCLPPVTIGGVKITNSLIRELGVLQQDTEEIHFFAESVMILASIDIDNYGIERKLFMILLNMFNVLKALKDGGEGGENETENN